MPNFPSIYLELQELWKRIRGLDESGLEIKQKLECISKITSPTNSTLIECDLRVSGSNNPNLYVGPLVQDSVEYPSGELFVAGRENDAYISTWDGEARTVLGSTSGIGFVGTQTDDNFTVRQDNDAIITVKKVSGQSRIVTISGSMEITGSLNNGFNCLTDGIFSHAEGQQTEASGNYSHAEGGNTKTLEASFWAHAEGVETIAGGAGSHAEGYKTLSQNPYSHAEGSGSVTNGPSSHAEGVFCYTEGIGSHAEGCYTTASGDYSHAEGDRCIADVGSYTHAEGGITKAYQTYAHAEGLRTYANGYASHTEGHFTTASAYYAHAEGSGSVANASASHVEGIFCYTEGIGSHAEGYQTTASGQYSHAEGIRSVASASNSHAEGIYTIAIKNNQHVQGQYNATSSTALMLIGNGTGLEPENRSNILEVETGSVYIGGELQLKSGNGIKFGTSYNLAVTSTTLEDYEEGTWTPLTSSGLTGVSQTSGSYVKIGSLVHITGLLKASTAITASIGDYIRGFPYNPSDKSLDSSPVLFTNHNKASRANISNGYLYGETVVLTWSDRLYIPAFTSSDDIKFSCTYRTS